VSQQITPPQPQPKRKHIFSVRLTSAERQAIQQLARQMNVSPSHLARHFLMQAVEYYTNRKEG
jgi:predicted transcriptional regulator